MNEINNRHQPFLPEGYEVPREEGTFFNKFPEGDTTFRILSPVTFGWRYWNLEGKPVYSKEEFVEQPMDARPNDDGTWFPQHFWVFIAGHYESKSIKVVQMHQKSIQDEITSLYKKPKWGDPKGYDIVINRKGSGQFDTEYSVQPEPPSDIPDWMIEQVQNMQIKLENVFSTDQQVISRGAPQLAAGQPEPEPEPVDPGPTEEELNRPASSEEEVKIEDIPF